MLVVICVRMRARRLQTLASTKTFNYIHIDTGCDMHIIHIDRFETAYMQKIIFVCPLARNDTCILEYSSVHCHAHVRYMCISIYV